MRNPKITSLVAEISEYLPRNKYGTLAVPIDLSKIVNGYNLSLKKATFKQPNISGAFDRTKRIIYVNPTDPHTRQMFTIAHELGHYFLHDDVAEDILYREKTKKDRSSHRETEADAFAAELLMPDETIRLYWPLAESIQQLADTFNVSFLAMSTRLKNLGYI